MISAAHQSHRSEELWTSLLRVFPVTSTMAHLPCHGLGDSIELGQRFELTDPVPDRVRPLNRHGRQGRETAHVTSSRPPPLPALVPPMIVHVLFVPVQPATSNAAAPTLASAPQNRPGGRGTVVTVGARRPRSVQRHARRSTRQRSLQQRNGDARAFSAPAALRASPESTGLAVTPVSHRTC